ncbi:hypothetical protein [Corynebacterium singulare]|uniref:hypothetical protein n=1 Tax=Corynebacterium singulare TaxID=161899 RepID=UPI00119E8369|nr:hypothetical protein [Corynebacterium singulare]
MAGASSSSERRAKGHQVFISLADTILRICWQKVAQWVMTAGAATVTVVRGGHPMKQPNDRRTHHNREVQEGPNSCTPQLTPSPTLSTLTATPSMHHAQLKSTA